LGEDEHEPDDAEDCCVHAAERWCSIVVGQANEFGTGTEQSVAVQGALWEDAGWELRVIGFAMYKVSRLMDNA